MSAPTELEEFYKIYDEAIEHLPKELKVKADVRRCGVDGDDTITFTDTRGRVFASVTASGQLQLPQKEVPPASKAEPKPAPAGMTKAQQDLLVKTTKHVRDLDVATGSLITELYDRIESLEGSTVNKALDASAYDALAELAERLELMEARLAEAEETGFRYRGYWQIGCNAKRGDAYTNDGSLWYALRNTEDKPCRESNDWNVVARKGKDAA